MRVLYFPQISMRSYRDNRWLLGSDAQITKMTAYVEALPKEWHHHWILPEGMRHHEDRGRFRSLPNVTLNACPWMDNVLQGRFYIPMREMARIAADYQPDVLLCEVPEHVRAWRLIQRDIGRSFPIVAMYEHVDIYDETKVETSFMMRQIEGYIDCDMAAFPLEGMKDEWHKAVRKLGLDRHVRTSKSFVWSALFSPKEVSSVADALNEGDWPERESHYAVIYFISRLSDNQRTRFEEFIAACDILWKRRRDFRVWFANPNEAMDPVNLERICGDWFHERPFWPDTMDRVEYLHSLCFSDIVPILYDQDKIYSVGYCEAIAARNMVPTSAWWKYTPQDIAESLDEMVELFYEGPPVTTRFREFQYERLMRDRSVEENIDYVKGDIMRLLR